MSKQVVNARRTESVDAPSIQKLVNKATDQLFGATNVVNLIERANLAVTLSNEENELMGHAAFFDYPNISGIDQASWECALGEHYNIKLCNSANTLFMHYFVSRPEYSNGAAKEIITTVYNAVPEVHYIFLAVPKSCYPEPALTEVFKEFPKLSDAAPVGGVDSRVLFQCTRESFVPVLHVRQARVQDHDDLTPIFNRQSDMLQKTYGDFFLAELIEAQDETMQCLITEIEGVATGFMSICNDVNLDLLNECFELGALHGLRKQHPNDTVRNYPAPQPMTEAAEKPASAKSHLSRKSPSVTDKRSPTQASAASPTGGAPVLPKLSDSHMLSSPPSTALSESDPDEINNEDIDESAVLTPSASRSSSRLMAPPGGSGVFAAAPPPPTPRLPAMRERVIPIYYGESNAFSIQLFCIDEQNEMRSLDLMAAAFSKFPDKDFAVITVPHLVPEFPLLQKFLRVTPRCPSTLSQELYVFHRAGLSEKLKVRPQVVTDTEKVEALTDGIYMRSALLKDLDLYNKAKRDEDGTEILAYVAEIDNQVIGIAILRSEESIESIRSHFNIEDFIYFNHHRRSEHAHLHHFAMNPIFSHLGKFFLKEILRLGRKTSLYYPLYPEGTSEEVKSKHSMLTCLNDLVPVRPRRQIIYPVEMLGDRAPSKRVLQEMDPYALCHFNRKLSLEPKVVVNARILVVGASVTGIAILETLAFCPHLRFNNLTLISPHGLPGELGSDELRDQMLGSEETYTRKDLAQISLRTWVNVVYGKVTAIDRKKRRVTVGEGSTLPFDHLILCTGSQYQYPMPTGAEPGTPNSEVIAKGQRDPNSWFVGHPPSNLFVLNDDYDAAVALYWVETNAVSGTGNMIIYGRCLRAYFCLQSLIAAGLEPSRLSMVLPPSAQGAESCFHDTAIEEAVQKALQETGVQIHNNFLLADWTSSQPDGMADITSARFTGETEESLELTCAAFFSFYNKKIDYDIFSAINDACLVFDGKLVIDTSFHTNDVAIQAAGPLTKFQRKYHAGPWSHSNFSSREVGIELALNLLALFDPTVEPPEEESEEMKRLLPMYRSPKIESGILPGGYHYLFVVKPVGDGHPMPAPTKVENSGRELVTGSIGGDTEYFRIFFNQYGSIDSLTCISKKPFETSNLICLFGMHHRFLNNMLGRWDEGLITDLYAYFREAWSLAVFHDRFPDFKDEIRELLVTKPAPDVDTLEDKVRELIEDDINLSDDQRKVLRGEVTDTGVKKAIETRFLGYLSYNYYHLPMYAKPGMV